MKNKKINVRRRSKDEIVNDKRKEKEKNKNELNSFLLKIIPALKFFYKK